ncbi:MAG: hypothetical protein H7330_13320 [Hymenobacteraceae bacterium]|nr:hypothetical protein [Hymenobacteraceae bacterium]
MRLAPPILTLAVLLAAARPADAQSAITITQNDMPVPGDTLRLSQGVGAGLEFQLTGPNQTWNFAALTPVRQRVAKFVEPGIAGGLAAFTFGPLGGANRASAGSPTTLPLDSLPGGGGGLMLGDIYTYFRRQATDYRQVGFSAAVSGFALPFTYATGQQDVIYRLPLTFGSPRDSSHSYFEANIPGTVFLAQDQNRVNQVDGWGTLTTPFGTFSTLRVRTRLDTYDSLALNGQMPVALQLPTRYEYKWLANGQHVPVLTISTALVNGTETVTSVEYRDIYRRITLGVRPKTAALAAVTVAPNPAAAEQPVRITGLPVGSTLTVLDAVGRVLLRRPATAAEVVLSPADLGAARGVLTLHVEAAAGVVVRRLIRP